MRSPNSLYLLILSCISLPDLVHCTSGILGSSVTSPSKISIIDHEKSVENIASLIRTRSSGQKVVLQRHIAQSHCIRPHEYKNNALQVNVGDLNKIISIENVISYDFPYHYNSVSNRQITAIIDVQAMISMEKLVDSLLPLNLIPAVVPEFKGITVGGSIQGLAAESTSFKFGFVHDTIVGFEAILGDGRLVWCDRKSNSELFYSIPGSFGTIAIITRVKLLAIQAQSHVLLSMQLHNSSQDCVSYMGALQDACLSGKEIHVVGRDNGIDFVEAIGFSANKYVSITGVFADNESIRDKLHHVKQGRCNGWGNKWFFSQVKALFPTISNSWIGLLFGGESSNGSVLESKQLLLPTKDYLFRHDQGSFWMASYRIPQLLGPLLGPLLDSSNMFRLASMLPWAFPKHQIMLQDFMLPRIAVVSFLAGLQELLHLYPIWLLPMRNIRNPRSLFVLSGVEGPMCNVGAYGIPRKAFKFQSANEQLERSLWQHNGRKVYYSHAFYSRSFFYNSMYDGQRYFRLRDRYSATDAFPEIFDKIVTKNGRL